MSPFELKFSQMILHTETSKPMYNYWSFLFVVLHKPTLLPSTFNFHDPPTLLKNTNLTNCVPLTKVTGIIFNGNGGGGGYDSTDKFVRKLYTAWSLLLLHVVNRVWL